MSELYIPEEALTVVRTLDAAAGHVEPIGKVLGIAPDEVPSTESPEIANLRFRELNDGTALLFLDPTGRQAIGTLPTGSIIDLFDTPDIRFPMPSVILAQKPEETELLTAKKGTAWDTYVVGDKIINEADITRLALADMLSTKKGAEGTQILSAVYSDRPSDTPLAETGHASHETPWTAIPENFVLGKAHVQKTNMGRTPPQDGVRRFARVTISDGAIAPLRKVGVTPEEQLTVLHHAFTTRAEAIAATNPTGLGGGTRPDVVLRGMLEGLDGLAEMAANGSTAATANEALRRSMTRARRPL